MGLGYSVGVLAQCANWYGLRVWVYYFNCATMTFFGCWLLDGIGCYFESSWMVCHCLLIEMVDGLAFVDIGFGLDDVIKFEVTLFVVFRVVVRFVFDFVETVVWQIEVMGFACDDVLHIVLTHFDFDHVGGLCDFLYA